MILPAVSRVRAAFTLIEVVVALGVAALAVVTLLGLLPAGLGGIQRATADSAEARVLQAIMADYQTRDWDSVRRQQDAHSSELLYFDVNCFQVAAADAFFIVQVSVLPAPPLPGATTSNSRLRQLRVRTSRNVQAGVAAFAAPQVFQQTQAILAQMDKSP